jgi:hypothetical protein
LAAMLQSLITRPNPQVWYTSSAGMPDSEALWRLVKRGRAGAERLAYYEWGCPVDIDPADREWWANSNPGLRYRLPLTELEDEFDNLSLEDFCREHLGIWDEQASSSVFPEGMWEQQQNLSAVMPGVPMFGVEAPEDRSWAAIGAAGTGEQGVTLDLIDYQRGLDWALPRIRELLDKNEMSKVGIRPSSPAGSLIPDLPEHRVVKISQQEYAQGCGAFYDAVMARELWHLGQKALDVSVKGAKKRPSADAWVWDPRKSGLDISPLAALTVASWALKTAGPVDILQAIW